MEKKIFTVSKADVFHTDLNVVLFTVEASHAGHRTVTYETENLKLQNAENKKEHATIEDAHAYIKSLSVSCAMKTVKVKYLLPVKDGKFDNEIHKRFLIENEDDILHALNAKRISEINLVGFHKLLAMGDKIILNSSGGYCGAKGTWQIVEK